MALGTLLQIDAYQPENLHKTNRESVATSEVWEELRDLAN